MVDDDPVIKLKTLDTEIAAKISSNNLMSNSLPFRRAIERLVQMSFEPKSGSTDSSAKLQIFKAFLKGVYST